VRKEAEKMKRVVLLLAAVAMLVLALAPVAQARAINQKIPISDTRFDECTGEPFVFEGTLHIVSRINEDSSGGAHAGGTVTSIGQGVAPSGAKYVIANATSSHGNFGVDSAGNLHFTGTYQTIRQGEDGTEDDSRAIFRFHFTENANGELTAVIDNVTFECR
jgi:hypothetical protein